LILGAPLKSLPESFPGFFKLLILESIDLNPLIIPKEGLQDLIAGCKGYCGRKTGNKGADRLKRIREESFSGYADQPVFQVWKSFLTIRK
jgi:hypothetical protein